MDLKVVRQHILCRIDWDLYIYPAKNLYFNPH